MQKKFWRILKFVFGIESKTSRSLRRLSSQSAKAKENQIETNESYEKFFYSKAFTV